MITPRCSRCENTGWVCENHPDRHGRERTLASVAVPECHALSAINLLTASDQECHPIWYWPLSEGTGPF
jgi:hypothetical protein